MIPSLFLWYLCICATLFVLTLISLIARKSVRLLLSTMVFFLGLTLTYQGLFSLTGIPQPVWLMMSRPVAGEAEVLGGYIEEGVGIFVLLNAPELGPAPKYYWFPYSRNAAESFQKAQRGARKRAMDGNGDGSFMMNKPFGLSQEERKDDFFHEKPQVASPPKDQPASTTIQVPRQP